MKRTDQPPRQLPLLPAADMAPTQDPVGDALGVVGADPDAEWALVMNQYARLRGPMSAPAIRPSRRIDDGSSARH